MATTLQYLPEKRLKSEAGPRRVRVFQRRWDGYAWAWGRLRMGLGTAGSVSLRNPEKGDGRGTG